jgi:DNA-binding NarL/FixJ family response regulator
MTTSTDHVPEVVDLTSRELAVLHLLVEGCTALAMAHRLGISVRTVQKHLEHVYRKLGVGDRLSAVLTAQRVGLLS